MSSAQSNPASVHSDGECRGAKPLCRGHGGVPRVSFCHPLPGRGLVSIPLPMHRMGCAEGRSPFAGGTGVSPVFGFITPFLARKGDGGMVETAVGHQRRTNRMEVLRQSVWQEGDGGMVEGPGGHHADGTAWRLEAKPFEGRAPGQCPGRMLTSVSVEVKAGHAAFPHRR